MLKLIALCAASLSSLPATGRAEDEPFLNIPPKERILETLRREHPRVIAGPTTFEQVRSAIRTDPLLERWHGQVLKQAEKILGEPPSTYQIPDGKRLLATSRRVLDRVVTLAYTYRMERDAKHLQRAWAELEAAAAFNDWNPSHFLDTAEMTCAFGVGYDWLYDAWTPRQRAVIKDAIVAHGLLPAAQAYRGQQRYGWWVRANHNWNQVCNGGIAVGALAIADEEPELVAEILSAGLDSLRRAMRRFAPDGGWAEGPGYWNYATLYNVLHLAALESALGQDFGFSKFPGFDQTGDIPIHVTGTSGKSFNFADGHAGRLPAAQMFWFARRFNRPAYAAYEREAARPTALDLIWAARAGQIDVPGPAPLDRHFEGIAVVTMRGAWDDPDAIYVGFKAGDNEANHSNLDLGSFVLDALGQRWACDLGSDNYNMPGYFGRQRWTYYRLRAEGHNTLVLNPSRSADQNPRARADIIRFEAAPDRALAISDLTPAYAPHAERVLRGIALVDGRQRLLVQDEIRLKADSEEAELWWFLHTRANLWVDGRNPACAVLGFGDTRLDAQILAPPGALFEIMSAQPLPSSPSPEQQNRNQGYRKLAIHVNITGQTQIAVVLSPRRSEARDLDVPPRLKPLAEW